MSRLSTAEAVAEGLAQQLRRAEPKLFDFHQQANQSNTALIAVKQHIDTHKPRNSVWLEHCDQEIAKCEALKRDYPHEADAMDQLIKGWQQTKQRLLK